MSNTHTNASGRNEQFSRNLILEEFLEKLNAELWLSEKEIIKEQAIEFQRPVVLLMGPMRSGTTLFMQWIGNTGLCACPTNLVSRFYHAPIIGAKVQLLLTDPRFNFRNELGEFSQASEYKSENGKTKGVLAPNEFWYFWRRFLAEPSRDVWTDDELHKTMDVQTMKAELVGMTDVFQKPFAAKGLLFNYNIPFLDAILDKVLFVQIVRDPAANVASVLDARKRQLGSEKAWYSFKIPEYDRLKDLDAITQCAGQVHYINKAVTKGMSKVSEDRKLVVQYEDFCANPRAFFTKLTAKLGLSSSSYNGPDGFKPTREKDLSKQSEINKALANFCLE